MVFYSRAGLYITLFYNIWHASPQPLIPLYLVLPSYTFSDTFSTCCSHGYSGFVPLLSTSLADATNLPHLGFYHHYRPAACIILSPVCLPARRPRKATILPSDACISPAMHFHYITASLTTTPHTLPSVKYTPYYHGTVVQLPRISLFGVVLQRGPTPSSACYWLPVYSRAFFTATDTVLSRVLLYC